jgi:hypothetical protein
MYLPNSCNGEGGGGERRRGKTKATARQSVGSPPLLVSVPSTLMFSLDILIIYAYVSEESSARTFVFELHRENVLKTRQ